MMWIEYSITCPRYHHVNEIFEYSLTNANILNISHVVVYMWSFQTTCIIEENFIYLKVCLKDEETINK